jgi:hypothetical protein
MIFLATSMHVPLDNETRRYDVGLVRKIIPVATVPKKVEALFGLTSCVFPEIGLVEVIGFARHAIGVIGFASGPVGIHPGLTRNPFPAAVGLRAARRLLTTQPSP